jgi:UDP:flavonoid glycosyltransferase YjiC (YdhE family)
MLADLLPAVRAWEPSLVVHDQADLAAPIAAAAVGVPNVCHSFGRLLPRHRVAAVVDQVAPLWRAQGMEPRPYGGAYDHLYVSIYPESLEETDTSYLGHVHRLRPVPVATGAGAPLPAWVSDDTDVPLVYVTFGTVFNRDFGLIGTVVEGIRGLPVNVVVTLGPDRPPEVLGAQPPNVHVAAYVPQTQLLPHCAVVVSHAGSGTVLASLGMGLPQLCIPQAADQFGNAAACARSGAALALQPGTVTPDAVRACAEQLLAEPRFRTAARGVADEIRAMPGPAEVADAIVSRFGPAPAPV